MWCYRVWRDVCYARPLGHSSVHSSTWTRVYGIGERASRTPDNIDLTCEDIKELLPGQALIVNKRGESSLHQILEPKSDTACSFERIYFSRGSDRDIYKERKKLGEQLTEKVLKSIDNDTNHTVISFIPNTAEVAFYGLLQGFEKWLNTKKAEEIKALGATQPM